MLSTNRTSLLLFLVMLQFLAPLLHAHAGQQESHFGMHLPGLESYFNAAGKLPTNQAKLRLSTAEGFIAAVNEGIQENRSRIDKDTHNDYCLALLSLVFSAILGSSFIQACSRPQPPPSRIRPLSLPPRAPPIN